MVRLEAMVLSPGPGDSIPGDSIAALLRNTGLLVLTARDEVSAFGVRGQTGDSIQVCHHGVDHFSW